MTARLEFWFEFASTYSYLSAMRIENVCAEQGVELVWKPFLLGPIFAQQGWKDSPFNLYPAKGAYMWQDMAREAHRLGVPFTRPSRFPQNGLTPARIACAFSSEPWISAFVQKVYLANFAEDQDISNVDFLASILTALGVDSAQILASAASDTTKVALRDQTQYAIDAGLFGAPSFRVGTEIFWGNDRLDQAVAAAKLVH